MDVKCLNIAKVILPAVRINMARQLDSKYSLRQKEIASRLGVAQVAVSKYLNGNYSESLRRVANIVEKSGVIDSSVARIVKMENAEEVNKVINELCSRIAADDLVN